MTEDKIESLLERLGKTKEEMQEHWNECVGINDIVTQLDRLGKNWTDLGEYGIMQLPNLKETTLNDLAKKKDEEEAQRFYNEHFGDIVISKIEKGVSLSWSEIARMARDYPEVYREERESKLGVMPVMSVVQIGERYFCIRWEKGVSEDQTDIFAIQPYEVKKHQYTKTIEVTEWEPVNKSNKS